MNPNFFNMAVTDMNKIEFYDNFPLNPSIRKLQNNLQRNKPLVFINSFDGRLARLSKRDKQLDRSTTVSKGRDLTIQHKDGTARLQGTVRVF